MQVPLMITSRALQRPTRPEATAIDIDTDNQASRNATPRACRLIRLFQLAGVRYSCSESGEASTASMATSDVLNPVLAKGSQIGVKGIEFGW